MTQSGFVLCAVLGAAAWAAGARAAAPPDEFALLQAQLAGRADGNAERLEREAVRRDALIRAEDRTPVDVVWRRTGALLRHLQAAPGAPDLAGEAAALAALRPEVEAAREGQAAGAEATQRALFARIAAQRRAIAFKNPLLDFDRILFLKHPKQARGERHMVDQYLGFNQARTGGVYVLEGAFTAQPAVRSLLGGARVENGRLQGCALENEGSFLSLDLDSDGRSILFAFTEAAFGVPADAPWAHQYCTRAELGASHYFWRPESTFHVFRARADGTGLTQLTDGPWNDFDPCFLPDGRIAFVSERGCGQCRCGARPLPAAVLHAMDADGRGLRRLSWHDTNEWQPSVDRDGMLVYTRWDYVDRDSDAAHHLWRCTPDGCDPRSPHGNEPEAREARPWMELSIRAVPGSPRYVAVAAPHHGEGYGSLVLIDPRGKDDGRTAQVRRLTPEVPFPEAESAPGRPHAKGKHAPRSEAYGTPWPLSEDFHLCVYDPGQRDYGLYLIDSFGNRELLYRDPALACLDPIPLKARPRPPVLPARTTPGQAGASGTVLVLNVYQSGRAWPAGTKIRALRAISLFPKNNHKADQPNVGHAAQALCRGVLGTVPVEEDGSACFRAPAGASLYFQALDAEGLAVQTMRSDTYVHPGETLTCAGCHEARQTAAGRGEAAGVAALRRPPSELRPEAEGSYPLTFPRLVQPVLDRNCVACHDAHRDRKAPDLHGDRFGPHGWSAAFASLRPYAWGMSGGNGTALRERQYSIPGQVGARASRLYPMLARGHHELKLPAADLRRIALWLDANSNFYGAYEETEAQARGALVAPKIGVPEWTAFERLAR